MAFNASSTGAKNRPEKERTLLWQIEFLMTYVEMVCMGKKQNKQKLILNGNMIRVNARGYTQVNVHSFGNLT